MSALLDCTLELAKQHVRFFPVSKNSKVVAKGWNNFSARATDNPENLIELFGGDRFNSGIACGKVGENLYLVGVDIDNKPGKDGYGTLEVMEECGETFPETWSQKTPSGGEHRLFWSPSPIRQGVNVCGNGIDLRGDGGYLVGPGSTIDGRAYVVLNNGAIARFPDWAIKKYQKAPATVTKLKTEKSKPAEDQVYALKQSVDYLRNQEPTTSGARSNDCFKHAAKMKDFGLEKSQVVEVLAEFWKCEPPLSDDELIFTVNNAFTYSKSPAGIAAPENIFDPVPEDKPIENPANAVEPIEKDPIDALNEEFFYVAAEGVSRVCRETQRNGRFHLDRLPVHHFHEKHESKKILKNGKETSLTKVWMGHPKRRTYEYLRFDPSETLESGAYNTWRGFAVAAAGEHDLPSQKASEGLKLFLDHVQTNVCKGDKALNKWVLNYFAHLFQRPGEKPEVSLVFKGQKGTGKTIVSEILNHLIGDNSVIMSNKQHFLGHFNSIMENNLLVTFDEAFWSGDKAIEGVLKDVITGAKRIITHKGAEPYVAKVYDRIIIIGNEDWLVPATSDERRFAVFNVGEGKQQDRTYFGEMKNGILRHGGDKLLMKFLRDWALDEDEVNIAPETEGLNEQKDQSLGPFHRWWLSCLQEGAVLGLGLEGWPTEVPTKHLYDAFTNQMNADNVRVHLPTRVQVGMIFSRITKSMKGSTVTKGNIRRYFLPPLDVMRNDWDEFRRFRTKWG
jgi:hypothetical protein